MGPTCNQHVFTTLPASFASMIESVDRVFASLCNQMLEKKKEEGKGGCDDVQPAPPAERPHAGAAGRTPGDAASGALPNWRHPVSTYSIFSIAPCPTAVAGW